MTLRWWGMKGWPCLLDPKILALIQGQDQQTGLLYTVGCWGTSALPTCLNRTLKVGRNLDISKSSSQGTKQRKGPSLSFGGIAVGREEERRGRGREGGIGSGLWHEGSVSDQVQQKHFCSQDAQAEP